MAVAKPKKETLLKRVYFDIEVIYHFYLNKYISINFQTRTLTNTKELVPVLIMALRCCSRCSSNIPPTLTEARLLTCSTCSPDGSRFWQFDNIHQQNRDEQPMDLFCKWLFREIHANFTVIAHNMGKSVYNYYYYINV